MSLIFSQRLNIATTLHLHMTWQPTVLIDILRHWNWLVWFLNWEIIQQSSDLCAEYAYQPLWQMGCLHLMSNNVTKSYLENPATDKTVHILTCHISQT